MQMIDKSSKEWNDFKIECAKEIGRVQFCKENNDHYKGDLSSKQNGQEGGPIGGQMVKRVFEKFESQTQV